jgi:ribosomal protein L34E
VLNQAVHCYHHPQRLGIGICVECRQVVCAECSTQFEGINRCARCLQKMAPKKDAKRPFREWGAVSVVGALFCLGLLYGGVQLAAHWMAP